ncbi:MAG: alpha/beta hydrolase [Methanobacterium sp.]
MPTVKVNDINMYYEVHGNGEPLLVIWGMGGEISSFVDYMNNLDKDYKLIFFDNRGTGRTDKPDEQYSFEMMAEDAVGLLGKLDIGNANVLGISMGSRIALVIAAKYPERVKSLILNVAASRSTCDNPQATRSYERLYDAMTQPEFLELMGGYPPTVESFILQFEALKNFDGRELLGKINAPALIVNSTKDDSTPVRFAEELFEGISNSKLILVEEDHLFIRTKPGLLIEPVLEFLEKLGNKSATKNIL